MKGRLRKWLVAAVAMVVVAVAAAVFWPGEKEPVFEGKKLSEWLKNFGGAFVVQNGPMDPGAVDAIRHMGTNALPLLVRWVRYQPSKVRVWIFDWAVVRWRMTWAAPVVMRPFDRSVRARCALEVLGPVAGPVVPELTRLALEDGRTGDGAMWALSAVGEAAVPGLLRVAEQGSKVRREYAMHELEQLCYSGAGLGEIVPAFLRADDEGRKQGARYEAGPGPLMLIFRGRPTLPLPEVTACLTHSNAVVRAEAAIYLGWLGQEAASAGDALEQTLNDPDVMVRRAATNAIKRIVEAVLEQERARAEAVH